MLLQEFFEYKNKLMKMMCENEELVKLVVDPDTGDDFDPLTLPYEQIFPFEYIPETTDKGKTYICFDVDIPQVINEVIYEPIIWIWVFTHKSLLRLPEGGVRTDRIAQILDEMLNGNRDLGLGEVNLKTVARFSPVEDFQGRVLAYQCTDTNRWGVRKPVPSRRR